VTHQPYHNALIGILQVAANLHIIFTIDALPGRMTIPRAREPWPLDGHG